MASRSKIVRIGKEHPFYRTSNKGSISESRLAMANHLGRNLLENEIVLRKDTDGAYDTVSNLVILSRKEAHAVNYLRRLNKLILWMQNEKAILENNLAEFGIDINTLSRDDNRYRDVDRDREAYDRRSRGRGDDKADEME